METVLKKNYIDASKLEQLDHVRCQYWFFVSCTVVCYCVLCIIVSVQSAIFTDGVHYLNETNKLLSGTVILVTLLV